MQRLRPKMVMLKVLQQYYSATNDYRVISFMSKYFRYQFNNIGKCDLWKMDEWSRARSRKYYDDQLAV